MGYTQAPINLNNINRNVNNRGPFNNNNNNNNNNAPKPGIYARNPAENAPFIQHNNNYNNNTNNANVNYSNTQNVNSLPYPVEKTTMPQPANLDFSANQPPPSYSDVVEAKKPEN